MATEVVMPQMGESIAEGTITKWLKNVGDHVERDEPLFEISTDNGLTAPSQAMIDTLQSVRIRRIGGVIGQLAAADLQRVTRAVAVYLGFGD